MCNEDAIFLEKFGRIMREQRRKMKISTAKAAEMCEISSSYYYYLEKGKRDGASISVLLRVARTMNFDLRIIKSGESGQ